MLGITVTYVEFSGKCSLHQNKRAWACCRRHEWCSARASKCAGIPIGKCLIRPDHRSAANVNSSYAPPWAPFLSLAWHAANQFALPVVMVPANAACHALIGREWVSGPSSGFHLRCVTTPNMQYSD